MGMMEERGCRVADLRDWGVNLAEDAGGQDVVWGFFDWCVGWELKVDWW